MKKLLLILAAAVMASASFVANAGNPGANSVFVLNSGMSCVNVSIDRVGPLAFTVRFVDEPATWVSIRNLTTGEYHEVSSPGSPMGTVKIPVATYFGMWEICATYAGGGSFYAQFFVDNYPGGTGGSGNEHVDTYFSDTSVMIP